MSAEPVVDGLDPLFEGFVETRSIEDLFNKWS
jgi:hypothetical protein